MCLNPIARQLQTTRELNVCRFSIYGLMVSLVIISLVGCRQDKASESKTRGNAKTPSRNIWSAREVPPFEIAIIEKAMLRYAMSQGMSEEQFAEKKSGLTDEQIRQIEESICMRLPDDVKAFFKVFYMPNKFIGNIRLFRNPEQFIVSWKQKIDMEYNIVPRLMSNSPAPLKHDHKRFEDGRGINAYHVPFGHEYDVNEMFIDIRNGTVVKAIEIENSKQADSIAGFLNMIAEKEELKNAAVNDGQESDHEN